jgi:hypothetical protein
MRLSTGVTGCLILVWTASGCSGNGTPQLQPTDALTLFSIDGNVYPEGKEPQTAEHFHGYPVLGKTDISDTVQHDEIIAAVNEGLEHPEAEAKCFYPRHGIRVRRAGETIDYVICFQCLQLDIYIGDRRLHHMRINRISRETLNKCLTEAGIPLAPTR